MLRRQNISGGLRIAWRWLLMVASVLVFCLAGKSAVWADTLEIAPENFSADLTPFVRYLEDPKKELTIEQVAQLDPATAFQSVSTNIVDFGFTRSKFWLQTDLENIDSLDGKWKLSIDVPVIEEVSVYFLRKTASQPELVYSLTGRDDFAARGADYRNIVAEIGLAPEETARLYIGYSSKLSTQLPLFLESPARFYERTGAEDIHNWIMFGLLAGMTVMSTIYLAALGFRTAFFYGAYILLSGFYLLQTDGYAFQYLWPGLPEWNQVAVAPIGLALVASGSLFARAFVEAPIHHPRLNVVLLTAATGSLSLLAVSFWFLDEGWFKTGTLLFVVLCAVLQLVSGALATWRGQAGAWLFLAGAVAVISSVLFGIIGYLNPGNFNQDIAGHSGRYALLFEGAAYALAIFLHTQKLRHERSAALRREVRVSEEKLALSEALREAESSYNQAANLAEARRAQLAGTAHDIKQPLMSLRMALMKMNDGNADVSGHISQSFDYLDELVRSSLERTTPSATEPVPDEPLDEMVIGGGDHAGYEDRTDAKEQFPVSVVLDNVAAMFAEEARLKGVTLTLVPCSAVVAATPVHLMRMVSNLVSNAVKYAEGGRVLVGCRRSEKALTIEVHDTGPGLTEEELTDLLEPYQRGSDSEGTGLGLALVSELAAEQGLEFSMSSDKGRGSVAKIRVPTVSG